MTKIVRLLVTLVAALLGVAPTTTGTAERFTYDVPVMLRAGAEPVGAIDSGAAQRSVTLERSTSAAVERKGTSTTPAAGSVATEAAGGVNTGLVHGPPLGRPNFIASSNGEIGAVPDGAFGPTMAEGQFWAGQNPASTPGYANSYGTPGTQVAQGEYPWIMGGTVKPGTPFVTRGAPGIGTNLGGAPEVVVNPGGVRNLWFHMPD